MSLQIEAREASAEAPWAAAGEAAVALREAVVTYPSALRRRSGQAGSGRRDERRALDGVSLEVRPGGVVGLLGPNGSGKSTLLAAVAGLRPLDAGEVRIFGEAPSPAVRARVGVVFQESCLDPLMTVRETLWLHGRLFGLGGRALAERIEELLDRFDLTSRAGDATRTLSGGLRRRLELARALLPSPRLLLLDEPTSGLDPDARRSFWELLRTQRVSFPPARPDGLFESGGHPQAPSTSLRTGPARGAAPLSTPQEASDEERPDANHGSRGVSTRGGGKKQTHGNAMTILLATNDVLEAERECDRVAFLHEGRLVAEGTPAELKQDLRHDSVLVECADGAAGRLAGAVAAWPEVGRVRVGDGVLHVSVEDAPSFVPRLFSTAGDAIRAVRIEPTSLEDAYFQLVGSSLRASGSGERSAPRTGSPRHRSQTMPPTSVGGGAHNSPTEERA